MSDNSPKWKRPSDVMVMRKRKKPIRSSTQSTKENLKNSQPEKTAIGHLTRKRSNPFGCSPSKRRNNNKSGLVSLADGVKPVIEKNDDAEDKSGVLWDMLSSAESNEKQDSDKNREISKDTLETEKVDNIDIEAKLETALKPPKDEHINRRLEQPEGNDSSDEGVSSRWPPIDWSLCTRMRFIAHETFDWCSGLTSMDEAVGLAGFAQCEKPLITTHGQGTKISKDAIFDVQKACMVWIHPNLPWCQLYPRMVADSNVGKPCSLFSTAEVQKVLVSDWAESLTSAYNMVRNGLCPYFYLCTHQFNVLWRAANIAGKSQVHAFLSPTTRGLRQALAKEGIEFSMPLDKRKRKSHDRVGDDVDTKQTNSKASSQDCDTVSVGMSRVNEAVEDDDDEDEDLAQTDEGASSWLQSIGLNSKEYKSLDPSNVKLAREGYQVIDQRPESCVMVEGPDTHALLNYLLNCRSCFATTGSQCGLPPTVLAPVAFKGATLKQLKVKSGQIHQGRGRVEQGYSLEVAGPILPHTKQRLMNLFSCTHKQFTASFSVHIPSAPFNATVDNTEQSHDSINEEICDESEQLKRPSNLGKTVIKEIKYKDEKFTWAT